MSLAVPLVFLGALVWVCVVSAAMYLVWRGLRHPVDTDHPFCTNCGYDLVGSPRRPDACTECGANLFALKAVRMGSVRFHPVRFAGGVVLLFICLAPAVLLYALNQTANAPAPAATTTKASSPSGTPARPPGPGTTATSSAPSTTRIPSRRATSGSGSRRTTWSRPGPSTPSSSP